MVIKSRWELMIIGVLIGIILGLLTLGLLQMWIEK